MPLISLHKLVRIVCAQINTQNIIPHVHIEHFQIVDVQIYYCLETFATQILLVLGQLIYIFFIISASDFAFSFSFVVSGEIVEIENPSQPKCIEMKANAKQICLIHQRFIRVLQFAPSKCNDGTATNVIMNSISPLQVRYCIDRCWQVYISD